MSTPIARSVRSKGKGEVKGKRRARREGSFIIIDEGVNDEEKAYLLI